MASGDQGGPGLLPTKFTARVDCIRSHFDLVFTPAQLAGSSLAFYQKSDISAAQASLDEMQLRAMAEKMLRDIEPRADIRLRRSARAFPSLSERLRGCGDVTGGDQTRDHSS